MINPLTRFESKYIPEPNSGCWLWLGAIWKNGYGAFMLGSNNITAHRAAYRLLKGDISPELEVDHLCRNRACVNPDHLEAVSGKVNTLRGLSPTAINHRKLFCDHGHELKDDNVVIQFHAGTPRRICRTCKSRRNAEYKRKLKCR